MRVRPPGFGGRCCAGLFCSRSPLPPPPLCSVSSVRHSVNANRGVALGRGWDWDWDWVTMACGTAPKCCLDGGLRGMLWGCCSRHGGGGGEERGWCAVVPGGIFRCAAVDAGHCKKTAEGVSLQVPGFRCRESCFVFLFLDLIFFSAVPRDAKLSTHACGAPNGP